MKEWKMHVKKDRADRADSGSDQKVGRSEIHCDPIMRRQRFVGRWVALGLLMWEKEVTSLRTSYAFREWRRKTNQILRNRGLAGKMSLLVELHWVLRDWRVAVMDQKADRMKEGLRQRWFNSLDQAYEAWGRDSDQGDLAQR
eukprot:Skav224033  [mRNA]  locus=scaffold4539:64530:70170:- [translate_table: standard]